MGTFWSRIKKSRVKKKTNRGLKQLREISAAKGHVRVAEQYFDRSLYTQALEEAKKVLSIYPMVKEAYNIMGRSYLQTGHFQESLYNFLKSLGIDEEQPDVLVCVGKCNFELNLYKIAEQAFESALKYNANHDEAYYYLGYIAGEINNDYKTALQYLERYTTLVPFSPRIKEIKNLMKNYQNHNRV